MTIPTWLRFFVLVAGPALFAWAIGIGFGPGREEPRFAIEIASVAPSILLLVAALVSGTGRKRRSLLADGSAAALAMSLLFLVPFVPESGAAGALEAARRSILAGWPGRERFVSLVGAGVAAAILASIEQVAPSRAARWGIRIGGCGAALALAASWTLPSPAAVAPPAPRWSIAAGWSDLVTAAAILLLLVFREIGWSKLLARELDEEAGLGIVPAAHRDILSNPWRRRSRKWWPDRHERRVYVDTVLHLAFRKGEMRGLPGESRRIAQLEILRLRERIRTMLSPVEPPLESTLGHEPSDVSTGRGARR